MAVVGAVDFPVMISQQVRQIMAVAVLRPGYRPFLLEDELADGPLRMGWISQDNSQRFDASSGMRWYDLTDAGEKEVRTWKMKELFHDCVPDFDMVLSC